MAWGIFIWSLYWICYSVASALYFVFFGQEACGVLPQPGIKPTPPALEGKVLTTGPPGKSHMGSLIAACIQDLIPWAGIEPGPPAPPGKSPPMFSLRSFYSFSFYIEVYSPFWVHFCVRCKVCVWVHLFKFRHSAPFVKKPTLIFFVCLYIFIEL